MLIRGFEIHIGLINYITRLEIGLEIRHGGVTRLCANEDKTTVNVVAVASYRSVSRQAPLRVENS